jgi:hypothetical protein
MVPGSEMSDVGGAIAGYAEDAIDAFDSDDFSI